MIFLRISLTILVKETEMPCILWKKLKKLKKSKKAKKVESYIKVTNHFLKKLKELGSLPKRAFLFTIDVVGLYHNIPHEEGLASIGVHLNNRESKEVTTDTLVELVDIVLKILLPVLR